ncbi:uncharacterized protein [Haliotis asinina]|uniref:uncharacterized protein n=1 Tax=Haliotis asinina TaxID=109174 RepID=UPI0035324DFA
MKSVLFLVLLPVLVLSSPLSKVDLLEKLLEQLERRQFEDTTSYDETYSTQDMDVQTTMAYDVDTASTDMASDSPDMTPDSTDMTSDSTDSDMTTPGYDTMNTMYSDARDMTTPHSGFNSISAMRPREYLRQATEGVCMLLAFVKGQEKLWHMFGNNGGLSMMAGPDGELPTSPNSMKRLFKIVGSKPVEPAPTRGNPDESFPWEEAEQKLSELCQLINSYSSEPLQLAEALVEQMGAHMGR